MNGNTTLTNTTIRGGKGPAAIPPTSPPSAQPASLAFGNPSGPPTLTFAPLAWLKLQAFCHAGDTEVGGFGVSDAADPLYLCDFVTVIQRTTSVTVEFDDAAVADHLDAFADRGVPPHRCGRVWVHTHPGACPRPSGTDERTFARCFGGCDWSVMFVLARSGRTYARLAFRAGVAGPRGSVELPVRIDWPAWPDTLLDQGGTLGELTEAWLDEYGANVFPAWSTALSLPAAGRVREDRWFLVDHDAGLEDDALAWRSAALREEQDLVDWFEHLDLYDPAHEVYR